MINFIFSLINLFETDLANLVNIAAIKAAVSGADKLNSTQLEFAKDRIIMGTERKTMFISEDSKKVCLSIIIMSEINCRYEPTLATVEA